MMRKKRKIFELYTARPKQQKIEKNSEIIENIIYYRFVIRLMAEELQQKLPWREDPKVRKRKISKTF
jgi:hypothetical protein